MNDEVSQAAVAEAGEGNLSLQEVQQEGLRILKAFARFCDRERLRYSLAGGTLLGAVRHRGFIPWDDDVDVMMPRPDYARLLESASVFAQETGLRLMGYPNTDDLHAPFVKITNPSIMTKISWREEAMPLGIDLFPIDGLPESDRELVSLYRKGDRYRDILTALYADPRDGKTALKRILKRMMRAINDRFAIASRYETKLNEMASAHPYESSDHVGAVTWGLYGPGEKMRRERFEDSATLCFEGEDFAVAGCWESYLRGLYGDYMQLPPEDERKTHEMRVWRLRGGTYDTEKAVS